MSLTIKELLCRRFHDILTKCEGDVAVAAKKIALAYKAAGRQVTVTPDPDECSIYIGGGDDENDEHLYMELRYADEEWVCDTPGSDDLAETVKLMTWIDEVSQAWRIRGHGDDA